MIEFSRPAPDGSVKWQYKPPAGTGYEIDLYPQDHPADPRVSLERDFLSQADGAAASALARLERGEDPSAWSTPDRSAWSRFLMMGLLRSPEAVKTILGNMSQNWEVSDAEAEQIYNETREPHMPPTLAEFLREHKDDIFGETAVTALAHLMDSAEIGSRFNSLHWSVMDLSQSKFELVTSDNPVIITVPFAVPDSHIAIPIGPRRLFVGSRTLRVTAALKEVEPANLVSEVNRITIGQADRFVYALNESSVAIVEKHFGKGGVPKFSEVMLKGLKL